MTNVTHIKLNLIKLKQSWSTLWLKICCDLLAWGFLAYDLLSPVATIATLGEQVPLPYPVTNCYNYFSTSVIQTQLPLQFTVIMLLMLTILNRFNNSKYLFAPCYYFHPPILGWEFLPNISPPTPSLFLSQ